MTTGSACRVLQPAVYQRVHVSSTHMCHCSEVTTRQLISTRERRERRPGTSAVNSNGKTASTETETSLLTTGQSHSIYISPATENCDNGRHDPRLAGSAVNEEQGADGSCFHAGRPTAGSAEGNLSQRGNEVSEREESSRTNSAETRNYGCLRQTHGHLLCDSRHEV